MKKLILSCLFLLSTGLVIAQQPNRPQQQTNPVVQAIVAEANGNSQLERLAHELVDQIGPRLVGTPQMQRAHDWAVAKYAGWGITARNEKWGEWRGWERGISHIDLVSPRVRSLEGMQLNYIQVYLRIQS